MRKATKGKSIKRVESEFSFANDKTKSNTLTAENMIFKSFDISTHSHAFTSFIKMRLQLIFFIALCHASLLAQNTVNKIDFIECANESMNKGDFITAIDQYNTLLLINPTDTESYFNRAVIESDYGDDKAAINDFSTCIKADSNQVDYFFLRGICFKNTGELIKSEVDFKKANALEPSNADLHMHYGDVLFSLKKYESAILEYNKALELKSDNTSNIFYSLSKIYAQQKKTNEYLKHLQLAVDASEDNAAAAAELTQYYITQSKVKEAVNVLLRMLKANKEAKFDVLYFDIPSTLLKECFTQIIIQSRSNISVDTLELACLQTKAMMCLNMPDSAQTMLERYTQHSDIKLQYNQALCYYFMQDYTKALTILNASNEEYALRFSSLRLEVFQKTKNKTAYCEELEKNKKLQHRFFESAMCEPTK